LKTSKRDRGVNQKRIKRRNENYGNATTTTNNRLCGAPISRWDVGVAPLRLRLTLAGTQRKPTTLNAHCRYGMKNKTSPRVLLGNILKEGMMIPVNWKEAERLVKTKLEKEFKREFDKQDMKIVRKNWEFDLVSKDKKVVAQVKLCQKKLKDLSNPQLMTRFKRGYLFDCFLLEKVKAQTKIFFLVAFSRF